VTNAYKEEDGIAMRPNKKEYLPLAQKYIDLVPDGNIVEILQQQNEENLSLLEGLTEDQASFRYAPDKWSLKTVIGHIADVERLWCYRLLRIARGDAREFSGYDRDIFAEMSACDTLPLNKVLNDYVAVRKSTISLIDNLSEQSMVKVAEFNDHNLSARASIYIIAGHEAHHINIIKSKYLGLTE